ncbi:MAG: response regulator [Candidatus Xenobia bacterium]
MLQEAVSAIRVLVVDDHDVVREGIRAILGNAPDIQIVGQASNGEEAVVKATETHPDIVLMDLVMPGMSGLEACKRITEKTQSKVVILTHLQSHDTIVRAMDAGCRAFLSKENAFEELVPALRSVMRGKSYIATSLASRLMERQTSSEAAPRPSTAPLTVREGQVLKLIVQGMTNQQMADQLHLSVKTIQTHRGNILQKLGLHSRVDLVRYAVRNGLADLGL